jgi:hypothetical protein
MNTLTVAASDAILQERIRRGYEVTVQRVRPCQFLCGNRVPESLAGYTAITQCTVHPDFPCEWVDIAFFVQGSWYVYLQMDLFRFGNHLEMAAYRLLQYLQDLQKYSGNA